MVAIPCQSFLFNFLQFDQPWSSLIEGDEDCIGPFGELLCFWQTPTNYSAHEFQLPNMFDCWAATVVHLLLLMSSMDSPSHSRYNSEAIFVDGKRPISHLSCCFSSCCWRHLIFKTKTGLYLKHLKLPCLNNYHLVVYWLH